MKENNVDNSKDDSAKVKSVEATANKIEEIRWAKEVPGSGRTLTARHDSFCAS